MSTPALNPLVEKIRAKYPGAYDDMDDATLTKAVLAKYPGYADLAAPPVQPPANPIPQGGGLGGAIATGENVASALGRLVPKPQPMPSVTPQQIMAMNPDQRQQVAQQITQTEAKNMVGSVGLASTFMGAPKAASGAASAAGGVADAAMPQSRLINPAKEAFNEVRTAAQANDLTVKTGQAMKSALDLRDYAKLTKEYVPAPVRGFLDRLAPQSSPLPGYQMTRPPLTYDEARKLYSATSKLSADEAMKLSPTMKAKVAQFAGDLGDSVESAASSIGKQQQYNFAMQKFAQGMRYIHAQEKALDMAKSKAWQLLGLGGAYGVYRELSK